MNFRKFFDFATQRPTPWVPRQLAMGCYKKGDYVRTKSLLRQMLAHSFEIPGTNCLLARALILVGRIAEARDAVAKVWEHRTEAPHNIVPRILWFQLAFALLDGVSPTPFLGRLKTALQQEGAIIEWAMEPVLAHLQSKLEQLPPEGGTPNADHALLTALVAALSFPDKLTALEGFREWREVEPQALD